MMIVAAIAKEFRDRQSGQGCVAPIRGGFQVDNSLYKIPGEM